MIFRPYQDGAVTHIGAEFDAGWRSVLLVLPTGAGKTVVFSEIARLCDEYGSRVCILVHRDTLLGQSSDKLKDIGVLHSLIAPGRTDFKDRVHVASIQTLVRRIERHEFDLLIVDEGHHGTAGSYRKLFDAWPDCRILGVTATPCRTDGRGLGEVYQRMVQGPSIRQLMDDGYLTEATSYGTAKVLDLAKTRTTGGDYNTQDLHALMDRSEITGDAVTQYTKRCPGKPAVAFCVSVQHSEDVAAAFNAAGYKAASVHGRMPLASIRAAIAGLRNGTVQVLTSCDLISEGFDAPGVAAAILLRPTKSLVVYLQQIGRALRPVYADGFNLDTRDSRLAAIAMSSKPRAIVLDHAGNALRFGLADEEREWSLDAKKKKAGVAAMALKICPANFCHVSVWKKVCPHCGHVFAVVAQEREINTVDGDLTELTPKLLGRLRKAEERAAKTYKDFVELGRKRGHSPKWALRQWLQRGGTLANARAMPEPIPCTLKCQGCTCWQNPPCSHCTDGHGQIPD